MAAVPPGAARVEDARRLGDGQAAEEAQLLSAYFGREDETVAREGRILKVVSLLRETLWAVIETVASDIDFDYVSYAAELFEAYRRARQDLN